MERNSNYIYGSNELFVPAHLNFCEYVLDKLWTHGHKLALINGETEEKMTYSEMLQQAIDFAVSLGRLGVKKGDVIGILSENRQEFWSAVIGVASTGAVVTSISTSYTKGELLHAMNISKPSYMICSPNTYRTHEKTLQSAGLKKIIVFGDEYLQGVLHYNNLTVNLKTHVKYEEFQPVPVEGQKDTLLIIYSSGTSGLPKGVILTHLNVLSGCCMPVPQDPKAVTIAISPWYHSMGLIGFMVGMMIGRTGVFLPRFSVELFLKTVEKMKVNQLTVVPPVLVAICKTTTQYDLSSVKVIVSGAAPLQKDTVDAVYRKFPNLLAVIQGYGASETTLAITRFSYQDLELARKKTGSVGKIVPGMTVKIIDPDTGKVLGRNQLGEICARGPYLMAGYVGKAKGSDFDSEGFYHTGDIGSCDDDDCFYIADRLKELIKYKGFQVPPAELEAVLLTHEAVQDAAVVGVADKAAGEVPLAFIVVQPGKTVDEDEIKKFIAERLSNPKHLRGGVRFVKSIPKTPSGKILRKDLRKWLKNQKSKI